jgi:hypothetical protein
MIKTTYLGWNLVSIIRFEEGYLVQYVNDDDFAVGYDLTVESAVALAQQEIQENEQNIRRDAYANSGREGSPGGIITCPELE